MNALSNHGGTSARNSESIWNRYRHNFPRHLLGVSRHLQTSLMDTLQEQCGHRNLRLGFTPYIALIGAGDKRPTELAHILGISRQACNQAIRQVETAGYITRATDPADGRARLVTLSPQGRKLRRDGQTIVTGMDARFAQLIGADAVADTARSLRKIYAALGLGLELGLEDAATTSNNSHSATPTVGALLPRLEDHVLRRLMELTQSRGHPGLKLSFGQVLTLIGPRGGRIGQIAATQAVSKQAISVIVGELEALGYLQRQADSEDARQLVLRFTAQGERLVADSVASVETLEQEFAGITGAAALKRLQAAFLSLYRGLQLEQDIFEHSQPADIRLLAHQLQLQLGDQGSQALGRLLLRPPATTR